MKNLLELIAIVESIALSELLEVIKNYTNKDTQILKAERYENIIFITLLDLTDNKLFYINGVLSLGNKRLNIKAIY